MVKLKKYIIGINWEQNSTAAIMLDGKILECISEERFSRVKNDERYQKKSIDWLLKKYRINTNQITAFCFITKIWSPGYILTRHYTKFSIKDYLKEQTDIWFPRIFKKKKISQLEIFKKKIDINQFPGEKFWKKIQIFLTF